MAVDAVPGARIIAPPVAPVGLPPQTLGNGVFGERCVTPVPREFDQFHQVRIVWA